MELQGACLSCFACVRSGWRAACHCRPGPMPLRVLPSFGQWVARLGKLVGCCVWPVIRSCRVQTVLAGRLSSHVSGGRLWWPWGVILIWFDDYGVTFVVICFFVTLRCDHVFFSRICARVLGGLFGWLSLLAVCGCGRLSGADCVSLEFTLWGLSCGGMASCALLTYPVAVK